MNFAEENHIEKTGKFWDLINSVLAFHMIKHEDTKLDWVNPIKRKYGKEEFYNQYGGYCLYRTAWFPVIGKSDN